MIAELEAITAKLGAAGALQAGVTIPSHVGDATGHLPPFTVAWGAPGVSDADPSVGATGAWSATGGITCTARDASTALALAEAVQALYPVPTALTVAGRHAVIEITDARAVQVDRSVTLTTTDTHPAYAVLVFMIHSAPLP